MSENLKDINTDIIINPYEDIALDIKRSILIHIF